MKLSILITALLLLVSCGKNESGKSGGIPYVDYYTAEKEEAIRQDFLREGREVLARYEPAIKEMFGFRTAGLIRGRLRHENLQLSNSMLYGERNTITRSTNRNALVTLYIGRERPDLSWAPYRNGRTSAYTRLVLHELLLLGEVDDRNFVYTDRILNRR